MRRAISHKKNELLFMSVNRSEFRQIPSSFFGPMHLQYNAKILLPQRYSPSSSRITPLQIHLVPAAAYILL